MITIAQQDIKLVVPMGSLDDVLALQKALLTLLRTHDEDEVISSSHISWVASLLEQTLFSEEQLVDIADALRQRALKAA